MDGGVIRRSNGDAWHQDQYESIEASVSVAGTGGDTDLKTKTGFETLFDVVGEAHFVTIEADQAITIRLNSATNGKISVTSTRPLRLEVVRVSKIFISTGGVSTNLKVFLS